MDVRAELLDLCHKLLTKLQGLPEASPLELGAFIILIIFVCTFLFMVLLSCVHCCCFCGRPKHQTTRVRPLHPV